MSAELEAAIRAAHAAGRLQRRRFGRHGAVEAKADDTPVTATDRDAEAIIRRILRPVLPGCGFLAEESEAEQGVGGERWIIDPLDGTKKFVRGLPFFGPCIALERDGVVVLGVMHVPLLKEMLWAERGLGAFRNGTPTGVSAEDHLDRAYVVYSSEAEFYRKGWSGALEGLIRSTYHNPGFLDLYSYAALASGRVDAVVNVGEAPWDIAAAQVIVQEAGGRLTDFQGSPSIYSGTCVASNGRLHAGLLEMLAPCR
jgi:histidinol phosphatase-like enzyme (inositol monophosphatase family)